jgi:hypothetical protein
MSLQDDVRRALQPLIDQGLVDRVEAGKHGGVPGQPAPITVMVNADDPETHRVDIMKLILQAGLKISLHLHPSRS